MQFKLQLGSLLAAISLGRTHYVRCVTPNPSKLPALYDLGYMRRPHTQYTSHTVCSPCAPSQRALLTLCTACVPHDRYTLHQLRCSGLMDAVRVIRSGYPSRMRHDLFVRRFSCVADAAGGPDWRPASKPTVPEAAAVSAVSDSISADPHAHRAAALLSALGDALGTVLAPPSAVLGVTKVFFQKVASRGGHAVHHTTTVHHH